MLTWGTFHQDFISNLTDSSIKEELFSPMNEVISQSFSVHPITEEEEEEEEV